MGLVLKTVFPVAPETPMLHTCRRFCATFILVAVILATGCGDQSSSSRGTIGVSVLTTQNPFFNVIIENIRDEVGKHGYEVNAQSGEFDVPRQQAQVKDFIVERAAAIVLVPCDSKSIGPVIQEANQAGIPVFTADIACLAEGAEVVCHIGTDNLLGGRQAGEAMIELLGDRGGKVGILDFKLVESCQMRTQGFKEVINAHNEMSENKIDIVAELPSEGLKDKGMRATEDLIQTHPDLAAIFAINDPAALGARAALEKSGMEDDVQIIGFDGQPEGKQAILEGKIYADPIQFPDRIGRETAKAILRHLNGEKVEPELWIKPALYRMADAEKDPELQGK